MELQGSCRCGGVRFSLVSHTPCPYMRCYCSICRKLNGGGGYTINIMGMNDSLKVQGKKHIKTYAVLLPTNPEEEPERQEKEKEHRSSNVRSFCGECGTHLWAHDENWAHWIYPFASAIDTELPKPPHVVHIMLGSKAPWVEPDVKKSDVCFEEYPKEGIEEWHKRNKCYIEDFQSFEKGLAYGVDCLWTPYSMRSLLQNTTTAELSPEATAGFILAFAIVGFAIAVLIAYATFSTNRFKELKLRIDALEAHPKLQAKDVLDAE